MPGFHIRTKGPGVHKVTLERKVLFTIVGAPQVGPKLIMAQIDSASNEVFQDGVSYGSNFSLNVSPCFLERMSEKS